MVKSDIKLRNIFLSLQKQMIEKLSSDREIIFHPTSKGDASELNWKTWLETYLPKRYSVDKAFVIDSQNNISQQLDLVIYDKQYSPFVFNQDNAIYIPSESVYAVFEVKQEVNKNHLLYAGDKIKSVRELNRTSAPIIHAGGKIDIPKTPFRIIGGILTLSSGWSNVFGKSFIDVHKKFNENSQVDIGCILEKGSFIVDYRNGVSIKISSKEESLIFFFLNLLIKLQDLGTVPSMDIYSYAKVLDSFDY
ncbi:MAG: hypothetical protein PHD33_03530 [Atribacterota bacterium]|nr:hypothetical protein [Atribacterota bacterium]